MIRINDRYYLSSDAYAITVCEKKINKKGETRYEPIAFCGTLKQVKDYLVTHEIIENVELLMNIDKVRQLCEQIDDSFINFYWNEKKKGVHN